MWVYILASIKICQLKQLKYYLALSKISEYIYILYYLYVYICGGFCL